MKDLFRITLLLFSASLLYNCNSANRSKSSLTGWNFNDPKYGNYIKASELFSLEEEELLSDKNTAMIPKIGCNVHVLSEKSNC